MSCTGGAGSAASVYRLVQQKRLEREHADLLFELARVPDMPSCAATAAALFLFVFLPIARDVNCV